MLTKACTSHVCNGSAYSVCVWCMALANVMAAYYTDTPNKLPHVDRVYIHFLRATP